MKIISSEQMREIDSLTISSGKVSGKELMNRAGVKIAYECYSYVRTYYSLYFKRFVILAGKGNNGGDAYVAANCLYEKYKCDVIIFSISPVDKLSEDARFYALNLNSAIKHQVREELNESDFLQGDVIVDGLLGTGFSGALSGVYKEWSEFVNRINKPVISIDIPSGLNGTTGFGSGIVADLTITVGLPKIGFFINDGVRTTGKVIPIDIGFPEEYIDITKSDLSYYTLGDASSFVRRVPCDAHKKSKGSVLIIGGSKFYNGAPILSGLSALRAGAGFVTVAVPAASGISSDCHSLIVRKIEDEGSGVFQSSSLKEIMALIESHDSIVIGIGLSQEESCIKILETVLESNKRTVFDADALNLLASNIHLLKKSDSFVFSPHPGEVFRLAKAFGLKTISNRIGLARKLSQCLGGILIFKGNKTITVSEINSVAYLNSTGSATLATAGSGDVLSGIVGALLANYDNDCFSASAFGVYLHGKAGELAEIDFGTRSATADDIIKYIPKALKQISPFS
ncbi:MAG: hypothetical protein A2X47_06655 [Lentisphaerae bacterium GWF2_38_69]|nr:MAG: hypothetical protein A2X47_06655 [Lentisphaerae bacterium GWF2_38_69]